MELQCDFQDIPYNVKINPDTHGVAILPVISTKSKNVASAISKSIKHIFY